MGINQCFMIKYGDKTSIFNEIWQWRWLNDDFLNMLSFYDKICLKNEKHYTFNFDAFKKGVYSEDIQKFLVDCLPYYHISKRKYLEKKVTYNSFTTVLRQICNFNKIIYTSQIKYDKSKYVFTLLVPRAMNQFRKFFVEC